MWKISEFKKYFITVALYVFMWNKKYEFQIEFENNFYIRQLEIASKAHKCENNNGIRTSSLEHIHLPYFLHKLLVLRFPGSAKLPNACRQQRTTSSCPTNQKLK